MKVQARSDSGLHFRSGYDIIKLIKNHIFYIKWVCKVNVNRRTMKLESLVVNFRKAIEMAKANHEPGDFFRDFPLGQCGNTSDILAQYLIDNKFGPVTYVNGTYYGDNWDCEKSHAWLVVEGLVIDITGDQFKYEEEPLRCDLPVYIGPMTEYYQIFEIDPGGMNEHSGLKKQWINYHELKDWYETILRYLE